MRHNSGQMEPIRPARFGDYARRRVHNMVERVSGLPLRWQIGTLVILGLIGIFTLFGLLGHAIAEDGKQRTINEWMSVTATTASYIDSELQLEFERLERLAVLEGAAASDPGRQRAILEETAGQQESFVGGIFFLGSSGVVTSAGASDAVLPEDYVKTHPQVLDPLITGQRYASGIETLGTGAAAILAVAVRNADQQAIGVLGAIVRPDRGVLGELVASARGLAHTGHAELVDQHDLVVASSESGRVLGHGEHPDFYEPLLIARRSGVGLTAPVGQADPNDLGQRHEMAFVPLRTVPWGLALGSWEAELSATTNGWTTQIILFGALTLALALVLVWLTTRSVARPVLALVAASRKIATGDLATPIPVEGEGEVRVLAQSFDHMRRELQRALSALALEESRYEGILTSMADAVITSDPTFRITAFNPSAAVLTGWSQQDALGRSICEVICSVRASPERCGSRCPIASPPADRSVRKETLRRRDGSEIPVAITRAPIRDDAGRLAGTVHVLRDVSAEAEVDRLKDEFLSTVSHELRTPLGFIMGYATTLLLPDAPSDEATVRRCAKVIADASNELKELVDNLLDMAKIRSGSLGVAPSAVAVGPLVREAVERVRVRGNGHRFATVVPRQLPDAFVDAHRVEQVLYNLLDNAIKYSPDGGTIRVGVAADDRHIIVSVLDDGAGIPPEELPTLFERFHRGKDARGRGIPGSGLGLAICKAVVEAQGGRIWAESPAERRPGAPGTAIRFTVPIAAANGDAGVTGARIE